MKYQPPWWIKNGHLQSIYPSILRKLDDSFFVRERIDTPDGDFLDLDWARTSENIQGENKRLIILTHGLEGHSRRPYMLGMAKKAISHSWDVLAWNFRACSGEPNRKLTSYHSGATDDLATVIEHALSFKYQEVALIGFSIGGNKTLLHLGRNHSKLSDKIIAAVTFSVPCDLVSTSAHLAKTSNALYMKNFLVSLKEKLKEKQRLFPGEIDLRGYSKIKNFKDYDGRYTAPMNGFASAEDYWQKSSSKAILHQITRPTLMISALDDPFLTPSCFPYEEVNRNEALLLESPKYGGHVGFMAVNKENSYWSEDRAITYLNSMSQLSTLP
jgi:predicted alpha/beta-fold hydrolase